MADRPTLSVLIPAFNEARTILEVLNRVIRTPYRKQIIIVDDGSTDGTRELVQSWRSGLCDRPRGPQCSLQAPADLRPVEDPCTTEVLVLAHSTNRGKGAAIRSALPLARGVVTLIQDADLEYDPSQYPRLVEPILSGAADAVYGSRYLHASTRVSPLLNRICVRALNGLVRLLYGQRITDEATCYKAIRTALLRRLDLKSERFEFCPEVTAKLSRMAVPILEVPVSYHARTVREGKKIRWTDALHAVWTLLRWRFARFHAAGHVGSSRLPTAAASRQQAPAHPLDVASCPDYSHMQTRS